MAPVPDDTPPGTNTPDDETRRKAEAFLKQMYDRGSVENDAQAAPVKLDEKTLDYLVKHKEIIELKQSDLMSDYARDAADHGGAASNNAVKPDGHFENPVYVIPGLGAETNGILPIEIEGKGKQTAVFMDEGNHFYDEAYYQKNVAPRQPQGEDPRGQSEMELVRFDLRTQRGANGEYGLPRDNTVLSDATLAGLEKWGKAVKRTRDELQTEETAANPLFKKDVPVYEFIDKDAQARGIYNSNIFEPEAKLMRTKEGKPYIVINEGYHKWTAEQLRDIQQSDAQITKRTGRIPAEEYLEPGKLSNDPEVTRRYGELLESIKHTAQEMGAGNVKVLVVEGNAAMDTRVAASQLSKEGTQYILLSKKAIEGLTSEEALDKAKGLADHEITHLKNKDGTPESAVKMHNLQVARYEEELADLTGAGALGSQKPEALAEFFKDKLRNDAGAYVKVNGSASDPTGGLSSVTQPTNDDLRKIADWEAKVDVEHPNLMDRVDALTRESALMKEYEKTHVVTDHDSRVAENTAVTQQVLGEMEGKWKAPMHASDAPVSSSRADKPGLSDEHLADIGNIRQIMATISAQPLDLARAPDGRPASTVVTQKGL